jgi:hypothetical protein
VTVDNLATAARQDRDLESELPDGTHHPIDCMIILARIAAIGPKLT